MKLEYYLNEIKKGNYKEMNIYTYMRKTNLTYSEYLEKTHFITYIEETNCNVVYRVDPSNKILIYDEMLII